MSTDQNHSAFRIASIYLLIGSLWILFSDRAVALVSRSPEMLIALSTIKGWAYVAITAVILYWLIRREFTSSRASEERLRLIEERFQLAMQATHDGLWDWDIPTGKVYFSPAYFAMLGYKPGAFPADAKTWIDLLHPGDRENVLRVNQNCIENRIESFEVEYRMKAANGEWRWILGRGESTARDEQGRATRMLGTHMDITERKAAEQILRRFEMLSAHSRDIILFMRRDDGRILEANTAAALAYGFTRDELLALAIQDLRAPGTQGQTAEQMALADTEGILFETLHRRKDGSVFPVEVSSRGATIEGERTLISVVRDITERKRAEDALQTSEARLKLFVEYAPASIAMFDRDMRYIAASRRYLLDYRLGEQDLVGRSHYDVFPEIPERWKDIHRRCLAGAIETCAEESFLRTDGSVDWVRWEIHPWSHQTGEIGGIILFSEVITERKQAQVALQESEQRFRQLADSMPQLVWTARPDGSVDYYNQRFREYSGISPTNLEIWRWAPLLHPDDLEQTTAAWQRAVQTGEVYQIEHRVLMADGSYRWHLSRGIPVRDDGGSIIRWFGTATDIHDNKLAEAALRQSEQKFSTAFRTSPDSININRMSDGLYIETNEGFCQLTGYTPEEVIGRTSLEINIWADLDDRARLVKDLQEQGEVSNLEAVFILKDGTRRTCLMSARVIEVGGEACILSITRDITERKQAEEELRQTAQELARSNAELEQFAYVASHDLQEPLRAVAGMVQLLQQRYQGNLDDRADEYIAHALNATTRMRTLINDLLAFSRVDRRGNSLLPVDSSAVLQGALDTLAVLIQDNGAVIHHDPLPDIVADASQLGQLFQNLISNAIKFRSEQPPEIHIHAERLPEGWCFSVRDNGIGIEPQYFERIFAVFQRLHTQREYPGTGIGLAICKKIVERHGGNIWVDSQPGQGSSFYFTIPHRRKADVHGLAT